MTHTPPIIDGAESWSHPGLGRRAKTGVVVVHGLTGSPITTRPLAEALAERGYCVEAPRLPGHGTNWRDMGNTVYADWRAEVVRVVESLRSRCEKVICAGLSMGGTLALDVATEFQGQGVFGVVAINAPILDRKGLAARFAPLLARFLPAVPARAAGLTKNDAARAGVDELAYTWLPTTSAMSFLCELPKIRTRIALLRLPILLAYSPQDHSVSPDNTMAIQALVAAEDVTLLALENSYHLATVDYDRLLLEDRIITFADRLSDAG